MTVKDIVRHRLNVQQLAGPGFTRAEEVVSWLGAVQAQDYLGALWSVGMRMKRSVEGDVEKAISARKIVRTWPMRGTLHFVSPKDVRWMLHHLTPRVFARMAGLLRQEEIDNQVLLKSRKLWVKALEGGNHLTRDEMYNILERGKIRTGNTRGLHLLACIAQQGVICFGPRKGKQHTFALLDEWLPSFQMLKKDEALPELALRYFKSHGPATIEDFMWWAGLTKADASAGVQAAKSNLVSEIVDKRTYWLSADLSSPKLTPNTAFLLPTFDEYGIAYKDRSAIIDASDYKKVGGSFTSAVVVNGKAGGVWRRSIKKNEVHVEIKPFTPFSKSQQKAIDKAILHYGNFVGLSVQPKATR